MKYFTKSYNQIVKGFTKITAELRLLEQREADKAVACQTGILSLETRQEAASKESMRARKTATKLESLFDVEE